MKVKLNETLYQIPEGENITATSDQIIFDILDTGFSFDDLEADCLATFSIEITDDEGDTEQKFTIYTQFAEMRKLRNVPLAYDEMGDVTETGTVYYIEFRPMAEPDKLDVIMANTDFLVMMSE